MPASAPAPAPAPPTPPIPLAALLSEPELGLRQLAGPSAEGDPPPVLHWVHTSEMADPFPYLLGGELLLSAGVLLKDPDVYVSRIVQAGAAALGFGLAPVYDTVPRGLVEACDRHGLPLLEVPPPTPFTAVARAVWRLMEQARHRELRRVTEAQQGLASAAARRDPVPAVLKQLASRLGGRAVLMARDGTELHTAGRAPGTGEALRRLTEVVTRAAPGAPSSASDAHAGVHLAAYALGGGQGLALGLATPSREPGDRTIAGVGVVLLSLLTAPRPGADAAGRDAALVRLLLGAAPADAARLLGADRWTVVRARGDAAAPFAAAALGAALGSALIDPDAGAGVGVGDRGGDGDGDGDVRILLPADREPAAQPGWTLGVSAPASLTDLRAADAQAARALHRAIAARTPVVRHREPGLTSLVPSEEAAAYARTLLAPLAGSPALTDTLRTWLSLHGNWDRTAAALAVHRNTVRQRIARCTQLLDADLSDPDVRMELWFALRQAV